MPSLSRDYYVGVVCFSQRFGTSCLGMAAVSHRCWCLADATPEMNDWYEPIEGACQGYLNSLFLCSGELPFNQDLSLGSSRFGLANVVLYLDD